MAKLRIHDSDGGFLGFDLRDILRALAPQSLAAVWAIRSPDESDFAATGTGGLHLEQLADSSTRIDGSKLLDLADDTVQVIWGDFHGALASDPDRAWLTIRAFDSSFFEIETSDQTALASIKSSFRDVRMS